MTRRRKLLVAAAVLAVAAVVAAVLLSRSSQRTTSDCDTAHALIADNSRFRDQMKESATKDKSDPASAEQYREWAGRMKDYADKISDPGIAGYAQTAATLAGRLADLVPKYRAKPDDPATARDYVGIGIEFGNAISRLDYACLSG
jgi:hypothetical protein